MFDYVQQLQPISTKTRYANSEVYQVPKNLFAKLNAILNDLAFTIQFKRQCH